MSQTTKQRTGSWGEQQAALFLTNLGYNILERNYKINGGKEGELDIVAIHKKDFLGETLCFVEVKTRGQKDGSAERATRGNKINKFMKAGRAYCLEQDINIDSTPIQFEQVSVYKGEDGSVEIKHYEIPVG
ncbi:MAG: YraN family protein [Candidatus Magasanikbacteria bacterium]|nr:YraN family protein [Candidatus Magasanikbacteria bacterium]